jgi:RecB family exonuclease
LDCEVLLANAPNDVRYSWQKLCNHESVQIPVLANEWAFHVPVQAGQQTEWLTGRLDRVARDGDRVLIIDWKTGTGIPRNPETDWQTLLYLYALVEVAPSASAQDLQLNFNGPLSPEQVQFMYVEIKPDQTTPITKVPIDYSTEKHEQTRARLKKTLSEMSVEEDFPLPTECPDRFCTYRSICGIDAVN